MMRFLSLLILVSLGFVCVLTLVWPPTSRGQTTVPSVVDPEIRLATETAFKDVRKILGEKGQDKDGFLTITLPRTDLNVNVDAMPIPAQAGIQSEFRFFRCPCGKILVVGQFCVTDYEANDVLDALHGSDVKVASMSSMFVSDRPHMMVIRIHGESATADLLAKPIKAGLAEIGDARNAATQVNK